MAATVEDLPGAFEELFERHNLQLFNYLARLVGNPKLAEELAQESFLKAFRGRLSFKTGNLFRPWLWTIAKNTCRDHWRKKGELSLEQLEDSGGAPIELSDQQKGALEQLIEAQEASQLRRGILSLPVAQREALSLWLSDEMSFKEIGQVLKRSPQAAKNLVSRAKHELKKYLERE